MPIKNVIRLSGPDWCVKCHAQLRGEFFYSTDRNGSRHGPHCAECHAAVHRPESQEKQAELPFDGVE